MKHYPSVITFGAWRREKWMADIPLSLRTAWALADSVLFHLWQSYCTAEEKLKEEFAENLFQLRLLVPNLRNVLTHIGDEFIAAADGVVRWDGKHGYHESVHALVYALGDELYRQVFSTVLYLSRRDDGVGG